MFMKYIVAISVSFLAASLQAQQPKVWSLTDCIDYATAHNIDIKMKEQNVASKEIDQNTAKMSFLPDLNGSIGQNFDFGRSPSKTGVIVDRNSANTGVNIGTSMPIFDGMKIYNQIKASGLNLKAAMANLDKAKDDMSLLVTNSYLDALFYKELEKINKAQVELTKQQVAKTQLLVDAGSVPISQLYDIKAQLAKDEVSLTDATNNRKLALLNLSQLLELEKFGEDFDIRDPFLSNNLDGELRSILPPDDIYNNAVVVKPQIKEQEFLLESSKRRLKIAKADYIPKLNFNASYSNGYYHYSGSEDGNTNISFKDQIKQNERKTIGFSLSIPIFNRFQVRNNVRNSRIDINTSQLALDNSKKTLYKEIQQAYYNAVAAQQKFDAATVAVEASQEAFSFAQSRYDAGKSTVYEYTDAKTKLTQSLSEQAQAKYNFVFRTKILDFYNGTPISL
ncbi:MAG: TolC family protein [Tannerellaceae bacterium]